MLVRALSNDRFLSFCHGAVFVTPFRVRVWGGLEALHAYM